MPSLSLFCHMGHIMTENRHGLIIDARPTEANGTAECVTALDIVEDHAGRRTTRHPGYAISQVKGKRVEEPVGWLQIVGGLRKTRHRGRPLVEWLFVLTAAAYSLIRIPNPSRIRRR